MLASASATQQPSLHPPPPPNSMAYLGEWFHQHSINRITPHDISIAVLIDIMSNQDSFNNTTLSNTSDASTNKFIINCIQHEHTPIFGTINRFITELTNVNPDLVQPFISTFSSIDSIDTLFTLFDQFKTIEVNKTSIYGIFLRKIILIFNNLLFDGVKTLFDNIMKYKSNQPMLLLNNDTIECTFSNTGNNTFHRSSKHTNNNNNTLHPTGLSSVSKIFPKLYYHNYIQSCKELDFMNANFFLHIYYDYFQNRSYSALNKSLLYYHFKYYKQATISLKESIKIAQQNNEHESLLLSLIILYKIKMIEYFHNESKNVELFILQALKFAQTQQNKSLSFISFYITLDYIQFKLLTGFHDQEITKQLYLLLKKCEQVSFQEFPIQQQQLYSKPLLLKELFPKSLLNHVKSHFYRFMGDRLLYQCHLRLKSGVGGGINGSINGNISGIGNNGISGSIGIGNQSNTLRSPLTSPIRSSSTASQGNHNHWIQSPIQSPLSSPLQSPSSKSSSTALVPLGLTRDVLDLYSDYELLSSKSIPNSDHTCYRLIIVHFIQLQDRENVNILMNQFRNIMDPSLNIDKCDLLYLESLVSYYIDENIHHAISKFISCFKLAEKFNFIQLLSVYLENCELLKNKECSTLLMPYLFRAIDYCEKNHLETYKSRCLLYLNHHHSMTTAMMMTMSSTQSITPSCMHPSSSFVSSPSNLILTHGTTTDIAYYYEILGTRHNNVEYLKKSLGLYLKSFCLIQSRTLCYKLAHLTKDVYYCKLYCNIQKELRKTNTSVLLQNDTPLPLDTIIDRSIEYFKLTLKSIHQEI